MGLSDEAEFILPPFCVARVTMLFDDVHEREFEILVNSGEV